MDRIAEPIVYKLDYIKEMDDQYEIVEKKDEKIIFKYPTIYIVHNEVDSNYSVYVGETSDIKQRTQQHLLVDSKKKRRLE